MGGRLQTGCSFTPAACCSGSVCLSALGVFLSLLKPQQHCSGDDNAPETDTVGLLTARGRPGRQQTDGGTQVREQEAQGARQGPSQRCWTRPGHTAGRPRRGQANCTGVRVGPTPPTPAPGLSRRRASALLTARGPGAPRPSVLAAPGFSCPCVSPGASSLVRGVLPPSQKTAGWLLLPTQETLVSTPGLPLRGRPSQSPAGC